MMDMLLLHACQPLKQLKNKEKIHPESVQCLKLKKNRAVTILLNCFKKQKNQLGPLIFCSVWILGALIITNFGLPAPFVASLKLTLRSKLACKGTIPEALEEQCLKRSELFVRCWHDLMILRLALFVKSSKSKYHLGKMKKPKCFRIWLAWTFVISFRQWLGVNTSHITI